MAHPTASNVDFDILVPTVFMAKHAYLLLLVLRTPQGVPTLHVRPQDFHQCWSVRLERSPGPCPQPKRHQSRFQAPAKEISVRAVLAHERR